MYPCGYASQIPLRFGDSIAEGVDCFPIVISGFDSITVSHSLAQDRSAACCLVRSPVAEGIEWDRSVSLVVFVCRTVPSPVVGRVAAR